MACGCTAQAVTPSKDNAPCCVVHMCHEVAAEQPSLEGRVSRCTYNHSKTEERPNPEWGKPGTYGQNNNGRQWLWGNVPIETPSATDLPFFRHCPEQEHDKHYCGCFGWD